MTVAWRAYTRTRGLQWARHRRDTIQFNRLLIQINKIIKSIKMVNFRVLRKTLEMEKKKIKRIRVSCKNYYGVILAIVHTWLDIVVRSPCLFGDSAIHGELCTTSYDAARKKSNPTEMLGKVFPALSTATAAAAAAAHTPRPHGRSRPTSADTEPNS